MEYDKQHVLPQKWCKIEISVINMIKATVYL
jgi:hypothetical protein